MAQKKKTKRKKKMKMNISQKKYKQLLSLKKSKKKMSLKDKQLLNDALYVNYCKCLTKFEYNKDTRGYPICMNSIYKKRNVKPPKNASRNCNNVFKKKI